MEIYFLYFSTIVLFGNNRLSFETIFVRGRFAFATKDLSSLPNGRY